LKDEKSNVESLQLMQSVRGFFHW